MLPLISVIIPVYKTEKYLEKCVRSVCAQTYKNLEIILIDDGSPDGCPKMCDALAAADARIKVIHQKNMGISAARNSGIDAAEGEYFMFVDSDDYIEAAMCETMYNALTETDSDMAVCMANAVNEDGSPNGLNMGSGVARGGTLTREEYYSSMLRYADSEYFYAWNKLYKRKLFENVRYPVGKLMEDAFVIHRLVYNCDKIVQVPKKLYNYLQRDSSIMGQKYRPALLDTVESYLDRNSFFIEHGIADGLIEINLGHCLYELSGTHGFANMRGAEYAEKYKRLCSDYRRAAFKALKYVHSVKKRALLILGCASPYAVYRLRKFMVG